MSQKINHDFLRAAANDNLNGRRVKFSRASVMKHQKLVKARFFLLYRMASLCCGAAFSVNLQARLNDRLRRRSERLRWAMSGE
jgi:hypothetical protein